MSIILQPAGSNPAPILNLIENNYKPSFINIGKSNIFVYRVDHIPPINWWMIVHDHRQKIGHDGVLILDCSFEGPAYLESDIERILDACKNLKIIILTQNHAFVRKVKTLNNQQVQAIYFHLFLPSIRNGFVPIYTKPSALRRFLRHKRLSSQSSWVEKVMSIAQQLRGRRFRKYTCLINRIRRHRLVVFGWLKERGYLDEGNVSMHGSTALEQKVQLKNVMDKAHATFPAFASSILTFERSIKDLPFRNSASAKNEDFVTSVNVPAYSMTPVSLVTETEMTWGGIQRLTEKTLKSVVAGHRILIAGNPNSCALVKNMGLRIPGFRNHYDSVPNPEGRLRLILDEFDRYMQMNEPDLQDFFAASSADCYHNITEFVAAADREIEASWNALAASITGE